MDTETLSPQSGEKMVPTATVALVTFLIYGVNIHMYVYTRYVQYVHPSYTILRSFFPQWTRFSRFQESNDSNMT